MIVLIIGANGGIGEQVAEQCLQAGYQVKAVLRTPSKLTISHPLLEKIQGDVMKPETFSSRLDHVDVVVSAIGEKKDHPTNLYSKGNQNLMNAMKESGVNRAFFISAQAIDISPAQPFFIRLITKYVVQKLFAHGYADQRIMEQEIKNSHINWTILRPPQLTSKSATGKYRYAVNEYLKNCLKISRGDVAHFILNHLEDPGIFKSTVEIAY